ncbi:phasin family protein [Sphingomonas corticis]|uniref:Phasin family protein n=1 Tax=Sphingomonas corticis TaxID=2722791 RepID=A0ABX1CPD8_9SPHN|nr:phasin family protein [Sphingomonas corticis]NJR77930.1 phasin family protein [Sphingomonas corticis]
MAQPIDRKRSPAASKPRVAKPVVAASSPDASVIEPVATIPAPAAPADAAPVAVVEPAVSPAPIAVEETPMNETIRNAAENVQASAQANVAKFGEQAKSAFEKGKVHLEDYAEFQKGNVEALAESARIAAKGFETLGQDAAAFAKRSFDTTSETLKAMAQVKSPTELMKLQADYLRGAFDALVAETSRSTEASLKLAGEVAKPLQNRMALAAEKVKVAA